MISNFLNIHENKIIWYEILIVIVLSLLLLFVIIIIIYVCVLRSDYLYKKSKNEKKASKRRDSPYFDNETFLNFDNDEL